MDRMTSKARATGFSVFENQGIGVPNIRSGMVLPLTKQQGQELLDRAAAQGVTVDEFLEQLVPESEAEDEHIV